MFLVGDFLFKFIPAKESDSSWLNDVIKNQFPYTVFCEHDISQKISDNSFFIWVSYLNNIPLGFVEAEFLENSSCRLNAVWVEDSFRRQKIGSTLVKKVIRECMKRNYEKLFLLVKEENFGAKELYKSMGFVFDSMHEKILDNSSVEVWIKKI